MLFKKIVLWANVLIFIFFGVGYLVAPVFFASLVDLNLSEPNSVNELMAIGGMMTAIAMWYLYCAIHQSRIDIGVLSAFIILFGLFAGRVLGVVVSGSPNTITIFYVIAEGVTSLLLAIATFKKK